MDNGNGELGMRQYKITGTGVVTRPTPEEIEKMKAESESKKAEDAVVGQTNIEAADSVISEPPESVKKAAAMLRNSNIGSVDVKATPTTELEKEQIKDNELSVDSLDIRVDPMPTQSDKDGYNQNIIGDPREGEKDSDGGIVATKMNIIEGEGKVEGNKTTGKKGSWDGVDQNNNRNLTSESIEGLYELTGFTSQVMPEEGSSDIVSVDVREYYTTMDEALGSVEAFVYTMKDGRKSEITRGMPIICFNEREKFHYIDGEWKRT